VSSECDNTHLVWHSHDKRRPELLPDADQGANGILNEGDARYTIYVERPDDGSSAKVSYLRRGRVGILHRNIRRPMRGYTGGIMAAA